jgi:hypothetical protein
VEKTKTEAGKSGKQAGNEFGNQFKSALTAIVGKISFDTIMSGIMKSVDAFRQMSAANVQLAGAINYANSVQQKNTAIITSSTTSYDEKAIAMGLDTEKMYENTQATKTNQGAIKSLKGDIENKTRAFEDSVRGQEDYIVAQETSKRSTQAQTDTINDQIYALKEQAREQIKALRIAKGGDVLDTELEKLQIQKNDLEIQRDIAKLNNDGNAFALADNQIKILDVEISLRQNKLDAIEFETKAIQRQSDIQQEALEKQKVGFEQQIKSITRNIESVRSELDIKKNKFDIDIEPAKRKLEDLQASATSVEGGKVLKKSTKDLINSYNKNLKDNPPKLIDPAQVDSQIKFLRSKFKIKGEDVIPETTLKQAFGDIIKSGVTDIDQASGLISDYVEAAASGRSAGVDLNTAITNLGFAFRTNNSQLGNLSGVQENWSDIVKDGTAKLKEQYITMGDLNSALRMDEGLLTDQEKLQAKILGSDKALADTRGSWDKLAESGALSSAIMENAVLKLEQTLGKIFSPAVTDATVQIAQFLANMVQFANKNPELVKNLTILALAFTGIVTAVSGVMALMPALSFAFSFLGGASVLGFLANALAGIQLAFGALMGGGGIGGAITALGMIMSPIGWVVLAIGALTAGVIWAYQNIEWFRNGVNDVFKKVVDYVMWAKDNWLEALGQIIGFLISLPVKMIYWIGLAIGGAIDFIKKINWGEIFSNMGKGFMSALEGMGKMLQEFFKPENLKKLGNGFMDFIRGLLDGLGAGIPGSDKIINPIKDKLPRFATGGSFMVGGKSGIDKNLIQFMATKGERVIIQTPNQQANNVNSGNVTNQNFINYGNSGSGYIPSFMTNFG